MFTPSECPLLHVLAAIDRDIGAGHERRPVRAQVDDKTCNFFGLAEASERDLRQDLSWDSPDDSRTGANIIAFPSSLKDRREVRTATGTLGQPERWSSGRSGHFPWRWHGSIRRDCLDHVVVLGDRHLRHLLKSYQKYYNEARTHLSLHKDAPIPRAVQTIGRTLAVPFLGGLHHQYFKA